MQTKARKILIADDEPDILEIVSFNLQAEGYEVFTAKNGDEAIEQAKKHQPDLIILDVMMPKKSGFEVLQEIQDTKRLKNIPVILFTNLAGEEDAKKGLAMGAALYLIKSQYSPKEVVEKVQEVINQAKK